MTASGPAINTRTNGLPAASFGIRLPNSGPFANASTITDVAAAADRLGYTTVWVHDHISWAREMLTHFAAGSIEACSNQDPNFYESVSTMSYLAGRFPRLHVGVAGLVVPLRDPRLLGKQLATLDQLCGGRVIAAAAIGNIPNDFEVVGIPYKRRARITEDYLKALRAILDGDAPVSYDGEFISFANGTFLPRPSKLRLWIAGSSEPGLRRAARYGDGWLTVYQSVEDFAELSGQLSAMAEKEGRDPEALTRAHETYVSVAETTAKAVDASRVSILHSFKELRRGLAVCLVGTPDDVAERIESYRESGVQSFELKFYCRSVEHMIEQMGLLAEALPMTATAR